MALIKLKTDKSMTIKGTHENTINGYYKANRHRWEYYT